MSSADPKPVDIDGNFSQVSDTLVKKLNDASQASISREQQARLLRSALSADPHLLAVLEDRDWQRSLRTAACPEFGEQHEGVTAAIAQRIQPGDVLNVSYYKLAHKVVVEKCSYNASANQMTVQAIHYGRLGLLHPVTVMREEFQFQCDGASVWLHKFPNSVTYTAEEALARALSRLGERQHHPTANNAANFALWCRVRDHLRNRKSVTVPMLDDEGEVHPLRPADHLDVTIQNRHLHAVVAAIDSTDDQNDQKVLTVVALTKDLESLSGSGMRVFAKTSWSLGADKRLERLQLEFRMDYIRKNAERFDSTSLCWDCTDLQAIAFLGNATVPQTYSRFTIDISELRAGHVITYNQQCLFVLAVQPPEGPNQTYKIKSVQYAPMQLATAPKTSELRLLVSQRQATRMHIVRHSEPDLQCQILLEWKFTDSPQVTESEPVEVASLQPGDPVCIREDTDAQPLAAVMPGLHAIVNVTGADSVEVICYSCNDGDGPTVETHRVPVNGHSFRKLVHQFQPNQLATREDALKRATARLGTGQYCCAWSNSRDFVRWCQVNHKANASTYLGPVRSIDDLIELPKLDQGRLKLRHSDVRNGSEQVRDVRLLSVERLDAGDLVKMRVEGVNWKPSCVHIVKIDDMRSVNRLIRVRYSGDAGSDGSEAEVNQQRSSILASLLGASLVNATDCLLGAGITDRDFCAWLRRMRRPNLSELRDFTANPVAVLPEEREAILDPRKLNPWDHVIIEKSESQPQAQPLHMLITNIDAESGTLCGYTYGQFLDHDAEGRLDMFALFPRDGSPYPMHKVIQRSPAVGDASSELSSALLAATHFPSDAVAWAQMAVLELESNLLLHQCSLSRAIMSMLKFGFRVAAREVGNDGSLEACRHVLASQGFTRELRTAADGMSESSGRRLYFLARLIAALIKPVEVRM